ncbi:RbsD/FucU domain-containing protein [Clostridium minihomine]|uniref:RbsD/FucU domain-containing protein n=1 Tax=Clostridium minihomine TaxID=2045012 RepID=UPI000C77DEFF|nr:RbsD/FucU domain-containing protein [Clostridium minihomine]
MKKNQTNLTEIQEKNPLLETYIREKLADIPYEMVPHEEFKQRTRQVKFAIRTGEFTPFPNVILRAGVAFPA